MLQSIFDLLVSSIEIGHQLCAFIFQPVRLFLILCAQTNPVLLLGPVRLLIFENFSTLCVYYTLCGY